MYGYFKPSDIKIGGWLKRQLEIQAEGLNGNLHKVWPDVRDSAWIGGSCEGWERVPYWLDGFIPLAYLLENEELIAVANRYISTVIDKQQEDGWICPCKPEEREKYDIWAFFLIGKVLTVYYEFTEDKRAVKALYKAMKCLHRYIVTEKTIKLFDWGEHRWFEAMIPLRFLYSRKKEEWIIELARALKAEGTDYPSLVERWKRPINEWTQDTHIVNLAMMLKYEAVCKELFGFEFKNETERLWQVLEKYNGTAAGIFNGDECLSGTANNQGAELCSVVELMYSCELIYAITGKSIWADRLEKIAYNALPATISDDMWTHQYDQLANQIACKKMPGPKVHFRTNNGESHLFGLEPNFGCCTANFGQGWPKLATSGFLKSKGGITAALMLPAELNTEIGGKAVTVRAETEYPFRLSCKYTVTVEAPTRFTFKIRIPRWVDGFKVNGETRKKSDFFVIDKTFEGTESFDVRLITAPRLKTRANGLKYLQYGALTFSLPIETEYRMREYTRSGVERKFPYCDYELLPKSEWRYGFADESFTVCEEQGDGYPFSSKNPRIKIKANMCRVDWDCEDGYDSVSAKTPVSSYAISAPEEKELYPYGSAKLRMTEMPRVKFKK